MSGEKREVKIGHHVIIVPPLRVQTAKTSLLGALDKFRTKEISRQSLFTFIERRLVKDDIVRILKANGVPYKNFDLKGTLCQKLSQLIETGPMPKETAPPEIAVDIPCRPSNLATCDSPFSPLPVVVKLTDSDMKYWKSNCKCAINDIFLMAKGLPGWLTGLFYCACSSPVTVVVILLFDFGERDFQSGCKNKLLVQLGYRFHKFYAQQNTRGLNSYKESPAVASRSTRSQFAANSSTFVHMPSQNDALEVVSRMSVQFGQTMLDFFKEEESGEGRKRIDDTQPACEAKHQILQECCVCFDEARQVAFYPCGHAVCCNKCSLKLSKCPICLEMISKKIELFFS